MISDKQAQSSLEWLHDSIEDIAQAKAKLELLDSQTKSVKADLMLDAQGTSAAREMIALAHNHFKNHLVSVSEAVRTYESFKLKRDYHLALVDAWRTASSNERALRRI